MGRQPISEGKSVNHTHRLTEQQLAWLREAARREGRSESAVLRRLIDFAMYVETAHEEARAV
jgi:hypothetical protein